MNNIIRLAFDPNDIAVVKTGHLVRVFRLDEEARPQRKARKKRKRKTHRIGPGPTVG